MVPGVIDPAETLQTRTFAVFAVAKAVTTKNGVTESPYPVTPTGDIAKLHLIVEVLSAPVRVPVCTGAHV
jgi:hypothetical protein